MCLIHSATRSSALGAHSAASLQPSKIEIELYSVEKNNKKPACIKTRLLVNCPPVAFLTRKRAGKNSPYVPYEIVITKKKGEKNIYTHTYIYIYKAEALHNAPCLFSSSSRFSSPVLYLVPKRKDSGGVGPGILKWRDPLLVLVSLFFFFFFFLFHLLALFKDMLLHRTWAPLFPASWRVFSDRSRFRAHTALASLSQTRSVYLYLYLFEKSPCETKGKKRRWWWHAREEEKTRRSETAFFGMTRNPIHPLRYICSLIVFKNNGWVIYLIFIFSLLLLTFKKRKKKTVSVDPKRYRDRNTPSVNSDRMTRLNASFSL